MKVFKLVIVMFFLLVGCSNEVIDEDLIIESVNAVESKSVLIFSTFDEISLPENVSVILSDGTVKTVLVTWQPEVFDTLGSLTMRGVLDLPETLANPQQLEASMSIEVQPRTVLGMLNYYDHFSILEMAIYEASLDTILGLEGPFTLFAPNDEAFETFFELLDLDLETFLLREDLDTFLLYHVLAGNYSQNVLIATVPSDLVTLEGSLLNVRLQGIHLELNQSSQIKSNIRAENGWIHETDRVLINQTLVEEIIDDFFGDDFIEAFLDLLLESDLPLDILLSGSLTVFIPNEEAFDQFLELLETDFETFIMMEGAIDLLSYHVFAGSFLADQLYNDAPINIRNIRGDLLRIDVVDDRLMIKDAFVLSTETLGSVGLIHVIDRVLIPLELEEAWFKEE